jgi:hypothetical protein
MQRFSGAEGGPHRPGQGVSRGHASAPGALTADGVRAARRARRRFGDAGVAMRFVESKARERLDLQTLHRARSRLAAARKTLINQLRAILLERGHVFRQGPAVLEGGIEGLLADPPSDLSTRMLALVAEMRDERRGLDVRIDVLKPRPRHACPHGRGGEPPDVDARHRGARRRRPARRRRRRRRFPPPAGPAGEARPRSEADDDRRRAEAARHQQAGEQASPHAAHPWRASGAAQLAETAYGAG